MTIMLGQPPENTQIFMQQNVYSGIKTVNIRSEFAAKDFFLNFWILFIFLYSRLLVIYFIHISVYVSIPISQFIPLPPHHPLLSPLGVHTFILYICVSISALHTGSFVPFPKIFLNRSFFQSFLDFRIADEGL